MRFPLFKPMRQLSRGQWLLLTTTSLTLILVIPTGRILADSASITRDESRIVAVCTSAPSLFKSLSMLIGAVFSTNVTVMLLTFTLLYLAWRYRSGLQTIRAAVISLTPLATVLVVKIAVGRNRPDTPLGSLASDPSFPSGHVASSIAIVTLLLFIMRMHDRQRPDVANIRIVRARLAFKILLLTLPALTAASRLVLGMHYPSDVLTSLVLCSLLTSSLYAITLPE
ncbi:phosphatase PAP2 family protein [Bifidobacterium sp.]